MINAENARDILNKLEKKHNPKEERKIRRERRKIEKKITKAIQSRRNQCVFSTLYPSNIKWLKSLGYEIKFECFYYCNVNVGFIVKW